MPPKADEQQPASSRRPPPSSRRRHTILTMRPRAEGSRRRGRLAGLAALALVAIICCGMWAWARPAALTSGVRAAALPYGGWLRVEHGQIVDGEGRSVLLRGFDDSSLLAYPNFESGGQTPLDDRDAQLMAASGFDVVRIAISWALLEPRRHFIDQSYLERIRATVRTVERHGLRVVLDMHVGLGWGPRDQVPAWASIPGVPDLRWFPVDPWTYRVSPQPAAAQIHFWTSRDWQQDFSMAWQAVAGLFRDDPLLAGYDLMNEPHPLPLPPAVYEARFLWPFMAWLIAQVSRVDARHLFIVEGTLFEELPTLTEPLSAPNLVYSPHLYAGSLVPVPLGSPNAVIPGRLEARAAEARVLPAALWIGELGVDWNSAQARAWSEAAVGAMTRMGIGWAWWQWRQNGGWGIRSADGDHIDMAALGLLARPYLEAAPSGVDAAGTAGGGLTVRVRPDHADRPVIVAWPGLTEGPPRASGTCVESSSDQAAGSTSSIVLRLWPGQGCAIDVTRAGG